MIPITMYKAEDGRIFSDDEECIHYERYEMETDGNGKPVRIIPVGESLV